MTGLGLTALFGRRAVHAAAPGHAPRARLALHERSDQASSPADTGRLMILGWLAGAAGAMAV